MVPAAGRWPAATTSRTVDRVWEVLKAFASFGFCKAHAAAFALPTYQSAWLKAHHPAAFLAGVLTHDPGMYPKRLILDDARQFGIAVLPLDVNASDDTYRVERSTDDDRRRPPSTERRARTRAAAPTGLAGRAATASGSSLADVKGICDAEVARIVAGRPYALAGRLLAPRRGCPGRWSSGWCSPGRSTPSTASASRRVPVPPPAAGSPGATCCCRSPSSTGGPGRWPAAPAQPRGGRAGPRPRAAHRPSRRPRPR